MVQKVVGYIKKAKNDRKKRKFLEQRIDNREILVYNNACIGGSVPMGRVTAMKIDGQQAVRKGREA